MYMHPAFYERQTRDHLEMLYKEAAEFRRDRELRQGQISGEGPVAGPSARPRGPAGLRPKRALS
jgi:hypothetical protein